MREKITGRFVEVPLMDRLWANIEKTDGCWLWKGVIDGRGYGVISSGPNGKQKRHRVHLLTYRIINGPYDAELELHHTCRVRHCCNPDHLKALTSLEHRRIHNCGFRTTHCANGHPYTKESTYISPSGARTCRICNLMYAHRRRAAKRTNAYGPSMTKPCPAKPRPGAEA